MTDIAGVIFDLGGVVFESPLAAIAEYEQSVGLRSGLINEAVASSRDGGAWGRFERGEIDYRAFRGSFADDCARLGATVDVDDVMAAIEGVLVVRPEMVDALDRLRADGYRLAALTNNFRPLNGAPPSDRFDVVVESSVEGVRKPESRIYEIVVDRIGLPPEALVFLDDIGANLKPARAMGMRTIKVSDPETALGELWEALTPAE